MRQQNQRERGRSTWSVIGQSVLCHGVWLAVTWQFQDVWVMFTFLCFVRFPARIFWMNAALCLAAQNHGSGELGAEAGPAADVHLSVPPVRAVPLLRGHRSHDSFRLSVWRGKMFYLLSYLPKETAGCRTATSFALKVFCNGWTWGRFTCELTSFRIFSLQKT